MCCCQYELEEDDREEPNSPDVHKLLLSAVIERETYFCRNCGIEIVSRKDIQIRCPNKKCAGHFMAIKH